MTHKTIATLSEEKKEFLRQQVENYDQSINETLDVLATDHSETLL